LANEVDVISVKARALPDGKWRFDVTIEHEDEGWEHYADGWEVVGPEGNLIASRPLRHPHVGEASFTRSKTGFSIPAKLKWVTVRGHDKIHAYGGLEQKVDLTHPATIKIPAQNTEEK
jgi:hypothetical protein